MNKYYYIINLFNQIDELFLPTYCKTAYSLFATAFIIVAIATVICVPVFSKKKINKNILIYLIIGTFSAFMSVAVVCFISIPFIIFTAHSALIVPDFPNLNKKTVALITVISVALSIIFTVCAVSGWLI